MSCTALLQLQQQSFEVLILQLYTDDASASQDAARSVNDCNTTDCRWKMLRTCLTRVNGAAPGYFAKLIHKSTKDYIKGCDT